MGESETVKNFCKNVCYLRKKYNLSQKKMAEIMGISASGVRRMEQEIAVPRINSRIICRVCDYFDLSADEMIYSILD